MDIRAEILKENSRQNAVNIANWVCGSPQRVQQLIGLFMNDEYRVVQRLAQVLAKVSDTNPELLMPHLPALVRRMNEPGVPVAVKRNVVRILQQLNIPEALHGDVMNTCFDLLADVHEPVAVRVFSATVLDNLSRHYPEIRQELTTLLEDALEQDCSPGFRNRAEKILKDRRKRH